MSLVQPHDDGLVQIRARIANRRNKTATMQTLLHQVSQSSAYKCRYHDLPMFSVASDPEENGFSEHGKEHDHLPRNTRARQSNLIAVEAFAF
jgi:hypothetical protein